MYFAIIQRTLRSDNRPDAFWNEDFDAMAAAICEFMVATYDMPSAINDLDDANKWFSTREYNSAHDGIYWWDTNIAGIQPR